MRNQIRYAARTKGARTPLPVSVFNWRISDSTYGFLSAHDRDTAARELLARFPRPRRGSEDTAPFVTFTPYRDTDADYAAQFIVWLPNQPGGYRFTGNRTLVSSITRRTVASLVR